MRAIIITYEGNPLTAKTAADLANLLVKSTIDDISKASMTELSDTEVSELFLKASVGKVKEFTAESLTLPKEYTALAALKSMLWKDNPYNTMRDIKKKLNSSKGENVKECIDIVATADERELAIHAKALGITGEDLAGLIIICKLLKLNKK
jgi:hypothetical protein